MVERLADLLERQLRVPPEQTIRASRRVFVALAATSFVLIATLLVAFDDLFTRNNISALQVGAVVSEAITAPEAVSYASDVLTEQRRQEARDGVSSVFDPPDPNIARHQTELARPILDYIENVRLDRFATHEQQVEDIRHITALELDDIVIESILDMDDETWESIDGEIINVLPRVMRESIRESQLETIRDQLPTQVSVRFNAQGRAVIVAIVGDLVRANTIENPEATEAARQEAAAAVSDITRTFARGEIVIGAGERLGEVDYEALESLGLLTSPDRRLQEATRALLATIVVLVIVGLYIARFKPSLIYSEPRLLALLAAIFLIFLLGARFLGADGQIYIYPTAAMALLYVAIIGPEIAIIGSLGLSLLVGLMIGNSLEIATMVAAGGLIGALTLRRAERLNSYFFAGLMVGVINTVVVVIFNLGAQSINPAVDLMGTTILSLLNGIIVAATAMAGMYLVTLLFNLTTSLKLIELSQPSQPLLQRLLREAPGTYQHSLQVANLSEQAANAIGANADLVHVAALYHDIGKLLNPAFFAENQQYIGNPHDKLNDPYRSADIILSHITGGAELAKQYRIPERIRDFILEHHGLTEVFVFYQQAVNRASGGESAVNIADFTYPGPKPQSRETAIMMIADSCESATRARKPGSKQEIAEVVHKIIEGKRTKGQLNESGLTLGDLNTIENIFVEMLQAIFHPRIDYQEAIARKPQADSVRKSDSKPKPPLGMKQVVVDAVEKRTTGPASTVNTSNSDSVVSQMHSKEIPAAEMDDDSPLPEVPPLPRVGENRAAQDGGKSAGKSEKKPSGSGESAQKPEE